MAGAARARCWVAAVRGLIAMLQRELLPDRITSASSLLPACFCRRALCRKPSEELIDAELRSASPLPAPRGCDADQQQVRCRDSPEL